MKLTIEIEEKLFGPVFAKIDRMDGVISIHLHGRGALTTTAKSPVKRAPWGSKTKGGRPIKTPKRAVKK
jgi:hypothetical protein